MGGGFSIPKSHKSDKKVVVIGGGYSGQAIAWLLDSHYKIVWIEPRDALVHKIGCVRACVRDNWADVMLVPQDAVLSRGTRVRASVTKIDSVNKMVYVDRGDPIKYDYVVIASGGVNQSPAEPEAGADCRKWYTYTAGEIEKGTNIVIVGGGPVGCELAGEIRHRHPGKKVTVVHKDKVLCNHMNVNQAASDKLHKKMTSLGINVITGEALVYTDGISPNAIFTSGTRSVKLSSGATLAGVDLIINCTGFHPSTKFMPTDRVDSRGQIKVNANLQVEGETNVFAIGDCNDVREPKTFMTAGTRKGKPPGFAPGQADTVYQNLYYVDTGKPLKPYKPNSGVPGKMMIPLGPGVCVCVGVPGFFGSMKSKHYFYPLQWQAAKKPVPKIPSVA